MKKTNKNPNVKLSTQINSAITNLNDLVNKMKEMQTNLNTELKDAKTEIEHAILNSKIPDKQDSNKVNKIKL